MTNPGFLTLPEVETAICRITPNHRLRVSSTPNQFRKDENEVGVKKSPFMEPDLGPIQARCFDYLFLGNPFRGTVQLGVSLPFVNGPSGDAPEDKLLRCIFGYKSGAERRDITERTMGANGKLQRTGTYQIALAEASMVSRSGGTLEHKKGAY